VLGVAWKKVKNPAKFVVVFGLSLAITYLLWIVFVGTFSLHELLIGIIAALLTAAGMVVVTAQYPARFSPGVADLLALWRLPWYIVQGTWEIMEVAGKDALGIKPAESLFRVDLFRTGTEKDVRASARRALAVLYTTVAPNFIVLGVNTNNRRMLFHQIERSSVPKMTQQLGAEG